MTRAVLRYVEHRITQHPGTDVTFEAECLNCDWKTKPSHWASELPTSLHLSRPRCAG